MHAFVHPIFASLIFLKATSAVGRFLFGESIKTEQRKMFGVIVVQDSKSRTFVESDR